MEEEKKTVDIKNNKPVLSRAGVKNLFMEEKQGGAKSVLWNRTCVSPASLSLWKSSERDGEDDDEGCSVLEALRSRSVHSMTSWCF